MFRPVDQAVQRRRRLFDVEVFLWHNPHDEEAGAGRGGVRQARDRFRQLEDAVGDINRYQRVNGAIVQPFDDAKPSIPVGSTSARWGSLVSFRARTYKGTKKMYGTSGNSFVAAVEFGDRVRARAVTAGGESGNTKSRHFNDQAKRYSAGELRDV